MNTYLLMMFEFFKTGLFAIGGGLATLPFLREISAKYGWYTLSELSNMIAIGNATPGPIGVILGGILATLALVVPSFIVILIVSAILDKFKNSIYVEGAFKGLRPAVVAMITVALLQLGQEVFVTKATTFMQSINIKHIILFAGLFILSKIIAIGAIIGIIFKM